MARALQSSALPELFDERFHPSRRRYDPNWVALRVSYGFNGIIVPQKDVPNLREHIAKGYGRRPPDHLIFEWFSGEVPETAAYVRGRESTIYP